MNIRGSMSFSGGIRLDGKLYGNLYIAEGSHGSVIMGPKVKLLETLQLILLLSQEK